MCVGGRRNVWIDRGRGGRKREGVRKGRVMADGWMDGRREVGKEKVCGRGG